MNYFSFSVLMSVYNDEQPEFLEASISSIYNNQQLKPSEIILVVDGSVSNDLNSKILFLEKKINVLKTYRYSVNKGLGFALNYGLNMCSNEIVFRMDSDDISNPNRFLIQIKKLILNPNLAVIGCNILEFNKYPGDLNQIRKVPQSSSKIDATKFYRNPFNHMTVVFKKSHVLDVGGYISLPGYEDYYLWIRLLAKYKGLNISDILVNARVGNGMINKRHGRIFFIRELEFQKILFFHKYISIFRFFLNIFLRALPRLIPISILKLVYKKILRYK